MNQTLQTNRAFFESQPNRLLQVPKPFGITQLQTTSTIIYTALTQADFWVIHFWAANVTAASKTYTIYFVPDGGSPGLSNCVLFEKTIAANTSERVDAAINHVITPLSTIRALCSVNNGVNIGGWGYDYTGAFG